MIYLQHEKADFVKTKNEFEKEYCALLQRMHDVYQSKGKTRDIGSPLHHRQSPTGMLSIAQAKGRRAEALLSLIDWETNPKLLDDLIEECVDAANYLLYIAALCRMLQKETKQ